MLLVLAGGCGGGDALPAAGPGAARSAASSAATPAPSPTLRIAGVGGGEAVSGVLQVEATVQHGTPTRVELYLNGISGEDRSGEWVPAIGDDGRWDTRSVRNGYYVLTAMAYLTGDESLVAGPPPLQASVAVFVANPPVAGATCDAEGTRATWLAHDRVRVTACEADARVVFDLGGHGARMDDGRIYYDTGGGRFGTAYGEVTLHDATVRGVPIVHACQSQPGDGRVYGSGLGCALTPRGDGVLEASCSLRPEHVVGALEPSAIGVRCASAPPFEFTVEAPID